MTKVLIKDIGTVITGKTPSKKNDSFWNSDDVPFIKPDDLTTEPKIVNEFNTYISKVGFKKANRIPKNSVIVTCIGTIGKVGINSIEVCTNQQINSIIPNDDVDSKFLMYQILSKRKLLKHIANAPVVPIINKTTFETVEVFKPSLSKQKEIADTLDKANELINLRKESIKKLDELSKSIFIDMFGDYDKNPKNYDTNSFTKIFDITTGKLDSNAMVENGEYPFFTCARETYKIDEYAFDMECLLLAGNNAAGKYSIKYYNGKFNAYQRTYILSLKNTEFSYSFFKNLLEFKLIELQNNSIGSNTKYLTMKILDRINMYMPPVELQNQFAKKIEKIEQQKALYEKQLEKLQYNFEALLAKSFEE